MRRKRQEKDTQTLRYDWFINQDETDCEVHEAYLSEQGLIEHNQHVIEVRDAWFRDELLSRPVDQDLLVAWVASPLPGSGAADGSECPYRVLGEELGDHHVAQLGFLCQQAVRGTRDDG